jgi:trk system potassium uptake protein TrkA
MKIIIVGAGEIGRHMALRLSREAHSIVVIEAREKVAAELDGKIDARVLRGDGTSINMLLEAGVAEAELVMALTSDNNVNLVASSMAKALGAKTAIARVHPGLQREEWLLDLRQHFGIDYIFSSELLAAVELSKFVRNPESLVVEEIARGHIELQQVKISTDSDTSGKRLRELEFPPRVRVGAILRGEAQIVPTADEVLEAGDVVTLFGEPKRLHDMVVRLRHGGGKEEAQRVVIFGGGEYGFSLAQTLEAWNCRVRVFDADPKRCAELTDLLANTTVLNADATSLEELREENIGDVDFFVAATGGDEDNVMTCLQAHSLGARHCLTLIHRADYADAIMSFGKPLGIMAAVSPREATWRDLTRFVTSDSYHLVKKLEAGELIEASVGESSKVAGKAVRDVKWPKGCVLVALLHGIRAIVPAADDVIEGGDNLYAVVSPKALRSFVKLVS